MGINSKDWRHGKRPNGERITPKGCKIARILDREAATEIRFGR